jgi:hypothetical protein
MTKIYGEKMNSQSIFIEIDQNKKGIVSKSLPN